MREKAAACQGCPLQHCGKGYVPGVGPRTARTLVIGEAPGEQEAERGVPFYPDAPSGKLLTAGLGGTRPWTRIENVRRCVPPENESEETRRASIAHCTAAYLNKETAALPDVRSVLLVGADALEWSVGARAYTWEDDRGNKVHEPGIMQYHGSMFAAHEAASMKVSLTGEVSQLPVNTHTVTVTLHPAFALRGQKRFIVEILNNVARAVAAGNSPPPKPRAERFKINFSMPRAVEDGTDVVLDIENPEDKPTFIEICCVAYSPLEVDVFPWSIAGAWRVKEIVGNRHVRKGGHNFGHDASAFIANDLPVVGPVFDTIVASARVWPPIAQKKLAETATKDKIPVKWLSLDRVVLRLLSHWAYWKRPETRATKAFYRAAFPGVPERLYRQLYCALDGLGNYGAWEVLKGIMQREGLQERFWNIDMKAFFPMINMERRGLIVDLERRGDLVEPQPGSLRHEAEMIRALADAEAVEIAGPYHARRRDTVAVGIRQLEVRQTLVTTRLVRCLTHTDYAGLTKRLKDPCCRAVWEENAGVRGELDALKKQIRAGRHVLDDLIGPEFDPSRPAHWKWLLFDKDGLNRGRAPKQQIRPVSYTPKRHEPQIDDHSFELLQRRHPEVPLFKLKIESTYAAWRLNNTLAVEPDPRTGRAHTKFSIHRTSTARYASGTDKEDAEKIRYAAAGNQQNIPDADRSIYVAPPGWVIIAPDYSQIEARVTAWRAKEFRMLDMWKRGEDIHTRNAIVLAEAIGVRLKPEDARVLPFPYDPQKKSYRDVAKVQTHAMDYGEGPKKMSKLTGMPMGICVKIHAAYFEAYPRLAARMEDVEEEAIENKFLYNAFALKLGPYEREKDPRTGKWRLADREEALAAQPQSEVGDMMKIVSADLDVWEYEAYGPLPELVTTMHDNFWIYTPSGLRALVSQRIITVMERPWPQLGTLDGYGQFVCPVGLAIGSNGGKKHLHDAKCAARGCDKLENPNGLVEEEA